MRKLALILLCLVIPFFNQSETRESITFSYSRYEFAITICPGVNNSMLNFAMVTMNGDKVVQSQQLTEQNFMMQITGRMQSKANPNLKNLLKEKVLDTCDCIMDDLYKKYEGFNCVPITILWKVRYKYDPRYHNKKEYEENQGWAIDNYCPSKKQCAYLKDRYKIVSLNDFIIGENMYQLLNDVQDSVWIENYNLMSD